MKDLELQNSLSDDALLKLIHAQNAKSWTSDVFEKIKDSLEFPTLYWSEKASYCEFYLDNHYFRVEIYIGDREINLWLSTKVKYASFELKVRDKKQQFRFHGKSDQYYYYKCDEVFKYEYPNEEQFDMLCDDVFDILAQSASSE